MSEEWKASDSERAEGEVSPDDTPVPCPTCHVATAALAWRPTGLCPACGVRDYDAAPNAPYYRAWLRARAVASQDAPPADEPGAKQGRSDG